MVYRGRQRCTRVTTKYKVPNLDAPKYQQVNKRKRDRDTEDKDTGAPKVPKAWLVLKTYDPESGVVLKFKTDRAADVGRLIAGLGRLGRHMAALPEKAEALVDTDKQEDVSMEQVTAPVVQSKQEKSAAVGDAKPQQTAGGGGGKKKKKGKK
ncbi:hypothetical protein LTR08_000200 [Meristemomyces frigidus]|nr:hypothetical protein LTR08_000200 [Meristemomyces frigidus]